MLGQWLLPVAQDRQLHLIPHFGHQVVFLIETLRARPTSRSLARQTVQWVVVICTQQFHRSHGRSSLWQLVGLSLGHFWRGVY
ncbi:hypothetical protein ASE98_18930 [Pseudomonas sp. Leaf48]|nr:hypothetical protein ASE98_18930 [Pseudomonas sp. Leaf48]